MERVTFLVEPGQERLGCLLNPESLVTRRRAGIEPRRSIGGPVTGAGMRDDRLLFTGGGRTEFELDLLFDVTLAGSSIWTGDVRDLTGPFWNLAENDRERRVGAGGAYSGVPFVRLIWGKSWNVPGVVVAVAERLERFTAAGVPQRSWLRLRLVRVDDDGALPVRPRHAAAPWDRGPGTGIVWMHEPIGGHADALRPPDEAFATAAALVASALERSAVAALLVRSAASVAEAAGAILDDIDRLFVDTVSSSRAALVRVANEAGRLATVLLVEPGRRWVELVAAAAGEVSAAVARGYAALAAAADEIGEAATRRIRASLDAIQAAVAPVAAAVGRAAAEVRRQAAALVAEGRIVVEAISAEVRDVLLPLASAAAILGSAAGRAAVELGLRTLDDLTTHLADLRVAGFDGTGAAVRDGILRLAAVVETLHDHGEEAAARVLQHGVEGLAVAARTLKTAGESLSAASVRPLLEALSADVGVLRAAMHPLRASDDDEPRATGEPLASGEAPFAVDTPDPDLGALRDAVLSDAAVLVPVLTASLAHVDDPAIDQHVRDAVSLLGAAVEAARASEATIAASSDATSAAPDLTTIDDLVRAVTAVVTVEAPATAALLRRDVADARRAATPSPAAGEATSRGFGERLEHIAYHHYGDPSAWRLLAVANDLDDPLRLPAGRPLRIVAR